MENGAQTWFDRAIKQEPSTSVESEQDILNLEIKQEVLHLDDDDQEIDEHNLKVESDQETAIEQENCNANLEEECSDILNSETHQSNVTTVNNDDMLNVIIRKKNCETQREMIFLKENPVIGRPKIKIIKGIPVLKGRTKKKHKSQTFENDQTKMAEEINRVMQDHTYYSLEPKPERRREPAYFGDFKKEDLKNKIKMKAFLKVTNDLYKKQQETIKHLNCKLRRLQQEEELLEAILETELGKQRKSNHQKIKNLNMTLRSDHEADITKNEGTKTASALLPEKSATRYEKEYKNFKIWQKQSEVTGITEEVLLAYILDLSKKFAPNSLWSKWSMLKSCLEARENIEVRSFHRVIAFLKRQSERYIPKKSKVLNKEQIEEFLIRAPDRQWLLAKVVTIFGIYGSCRCDELLTLNTNDVKDTGKYIIVTIRNKKNFITRRFTITDKDCNFQPCDLYRKYAALRPADTEDLRLFLTYRDGRCIALNAGQLTIGGIPRKIAQYLGLKKPELYTGHSFRRSAATMTLDAGANISSLKRARRYVDESPLNKKLHTSKKKSPVQISTNVAPGSAPSTSTDSTDCYSVFVVQTLINVAPMP